jgi:hypothetical protein
LYYRILEELQEELEQETHGGGNFIGSSYLATSSTTRPVIIAQRTGGDSPTHGRDVHTPPPAYIAITTDHNRSYTGN